MTTDIKHKHAAHLIVIEGHAFKANDSGMWDLTDIWRTLELPKGKAPAQWRTADAKDLRGSDDLCMHKLHSLNTMQREATLGTKLATIEYAAWVSRKFKRVVFHAFEAILESPEVARVVADLMGNLGHSHSADILTRMTFNDKCEWSKMPRRNTFEGLQAALTAGHLTHSKALALVARDHVKVPAGGFKVKRQQA